MLRIEKLKTLLTQTFQAIDLPLNNKSSGKVREMYALSGQRRLIITTDRLSAFDRILNGVPYKGQVLNQLASWWFEQTRDIIQNHLISIPDPNAIIAISAQPFPIEVIVRGFITGVTSTALWHRYALGERNIYGHLFPDGLQKNQVLPEPIVTPTTKGGPNAHDEKLTCAEVVERGYLDAKTWNSIQMAALALFKRGQEIAQRAGLILVDTKYEFGCTADGQVLLIDEIHTPDSSRYWLANTYQERIAAGLEPENFDKEFIRLAYAKHGYGGDGEPPTLPDELWLTASQRYIKIYEMLTGKTFAPGEYPVPARLEKNLRNQGILST